MQGSSDLTTFCRKQVDPEMAKYFSEVSNLFESDGVDIEERSVICSNALEETRGKELELATDYILSHTMQTLLEGCDVDHLCGFLQSCAEDFPSIAMDRSGSHVAETAIKSLAKLLEDNDVYSVVEETLTILCKVSMGFHVSVGCEECVRIFSVEIHLLEIWSWLPLKHFWLQTSQLVTLCSLAIECHSAPK